MIPALVGPTASGKTQIALEIAGAIGAEIVCADSMTVYRGMDIGTAKPSAEARRRIPHHLLDVAEPGEVFTVARYQGLAREAIAGIRARNHIPLVAGGSGLYFRAAVDDLEFPPTDAAVRVRLEAEDLSTLLVRLKERDPEAATFLDPANKRRVVRALEVCEITGRPFSSFRDAWGRHREVAVAGLDIPRELLAERVTHRLRAMLAGGFLDEVRGLTAKGFREALTSSRAIGYAEAIEMLAGRLDAEEFVTAAGRATLKLARRQMSWFRRDPRVRWFDGSDTKDAAGQVKAYYEEHMEVR